MEEVTNKNETDRLTRLVVLIQSSYKTLFRLPQKPFRTLTAIMAHCNECHQVEFGMNSIILFSNDYRYTILLGIQNQDFQSLKEFMVWKDQEEESKHTFYTLHDKLHRFFSCKSPNGDCKLNSTSHIIMSSASLL